MTDGGWAVHASHGALLRRRWADLPELAHEQVLFRQVQVPRAGWIGLWEADAGEAALAAVQGIFGGAGGG